VSLNRLWLFIAVALPVLATMLAPMSTVDLAYQLRAGDEILRSGAIPSSDTWTYTAAGVPWFDQQWGSQVILTVSSWLGGWTGVVLLRATLTAVTFGCLVVIARRRSWGSRATALLVVAAFVVSSPALAMRPQLFGVACLAVTLVIATERHRQPRLLWLAPVVVALWANLHGSFFLGPVVLGLAWLEDLRTGGPGRHRALIVALASVLAACITPFGPAIWSYAVGLSSNPEVTARITEWQPTSLRTLPGLLFFGSALTVAIALARRRAPTQWPTLASLGVFFVIGAYAERGVAWWALGAFAAITGAFAGVFADPIDEAERPTPPLRVRRANLAVAGALVLAGFALLPIWRPTVAGIGVPLGVLSQAPAGITRSLRDLARPGDRVFNAQPWGSWIEYAIPALPVAIDSRIEMFPAAVWDRYEAVVGGVDGWSQQLDDWGVTVVVVAGDGGTFAQRLTVVGWVATYADADGRVFVRPTRAVVDSPGVLAAVTTIGAR